MFSWNNERVTQMTSQRQEELRLSGFSETFASQLDGAESQCRKARALAITYLTREAFDIPLGLRQDMLDALFHIIQLLERNTTLLILQGTVAKVAVNSGQRVPPVFNAAFGEILKTLLEDLKKATARYELLLSAF